MRLIAFISAVLVTTLASAAAAAGPKPAADPVRVVQITGDDTMKLNVTTIAARRGEQIRLRFTSKGKLPKVAMAHNVVVLQLGTDADKFVTAGLAHRATDFIAPELANRVLAKTAMAGPGETVEVVFKVPAKAGSYPFVCTFAGHYQLGMKGTLVVK